MAGALATAVFHRHRGGPDQDLDLDLRQAVHTVNPGAFWHPTLNGEPALRSGVALRVPRGARLPVALAPTGTPRRPRMVAMAPAVTDPLKVTARVRVMA